MGRVYLGLSSAEFWQSTPDEYRALCERHSDIQEQENYRTFAIVAEIRNSNREKSSDKVWQPTDFFTPRGVKQKAVRRATAEEWCHHAEMLQAFSWGGRTPPPELNVI